MTQRRKGLRWFYVYQRRPLKDLSIKNQTAYCRGLRALQLIHQESVFFTLLMLAGFNHPWAGGRRTYRVAPARIGIATKGIDVIFPDANTGVIRKVHMKVFIQDVLSPPPVCRAIVALRARININVKIQVRISVRTDGTGLAAYPIDSEIYYITGSMK